MAGGGYGGFYGGGGGNKPKPGGNKPKGNNNKPKSGLYKDARRDVKLANRPALRSLARETTRGTNEFADLAAGVDSAYGGYQNLIAPLASQYGQQTSGIAGGLQQNLAGLASLIPGNLPPAEQAAAAGVFGQFGAGALEQLASQAQRNAGYQQSAVREGGLAQRSAQGNITQGLQDFQQAQRDRRMDISGDMAAQIRQRMDELRQQQLENRLARSDLQSNQAFSKFLIDMIGGQI